MTRLFRRGELPVAVLEVLADAGPSNGYGIMQQLSTRVAGAWRPSPGAVYPALLGLEDAGLVTAVETEGQRVYRLSVEGGRAVAEHDGVLDEVTARAATLDAKASSKGPTLGEVVAAFVANLPSSDLLLTRDQETLVRAQMQRVTDDLVTIIEKERPNG